MAKMTEEQIRKHKENPNTTLKLKGKAFFCQCGCNVFHHPNGDDDEFKCNSCGDTYFTA